MPPSPIFSPFPRPPSCPCQSARAAPEYFPLLSPILLSLSLASGALFSSVAPVAPDLPCPCSPSFTIHLSPWHRSYQLAKERERGTEGGREGLPLYDIKVKRLQQILEQTRQICFKYFCRSLRNSKEAANAVDLSPDTSLMKRQAVGIPFWTQQTYPVFPSVWTIRILYSTWINLSVLWWGAWDVIEKKFF